MELKLPHIIRLYHVFLENKDSDNCAQLIEEEFVATRPETVESPVFPYHPKIMLVHTWYINVYIKSSITTALLIEISYRVLYYNEDYNKVAEGQLMR